MTMPIGAFRDFANARATNFSICKQTFYSTHEIHENRLNIRYTFPEGVKEFIPVLPILLDIFILKPFKA
jgi:hypothetical protein